MWTWPDPDLDEHIMIGVWVEAGLAVVAAAVVASQVEALRRERDDPHYQPRHRRP